MRTGGFKLVGPFVYALASFVRMGNLECYNPLLRRTTCQESLIPRLHTTSRTNGRFLCKAVCPQAVFVYITPTCKVIANVLKFQFDI